MSLFEIESEIIKAKFNKEDKSIIKNLKRMRKKLIQNEKK